MAVVSIRVSKIDQPSALRIRTRMGREPNRISSSGRYGSDPFMLDQRTRSVLRVPHRTALDCNPNCNRQVCSSPWLSAWLPADDSVTPWSSSPSPGLFPAIWPCPVLAQAPPRTR
jgi:hypothetical protein